MTKIEYDIPVEVNQKQYNAIRKDYGHVCAHREDRQNGKFYIKLWYTTYVDRVMLCLNNNQ